MNRRELILAIAAIPIGAVAAAKPQTVLFVGDTMIKPLVPLNVCGDGVVPGVGIVYSSSLASGWTAKISIGAPMATDGSTVDSWSRKRYLRRSSS